ncbi:MAG: hypothetical protein OES46_15465 [Gammaproteobacteria bacterium]|nr:hypothetical protein [Gammaproteobacteria bacterium]
MSFLSRVCSALTNAKVRYAVVGGYAVALHGAVRGTIDVDVVLPWTKASLERAERALGQIGLQSRLPIKANDVFRYRDEYITNRNLVAWNFYNPRDLSEQVDLIITYDLRGKKVKRVDLAEGPINILNIVDIIKMKEESGRPQDIEDVKALKRLR